MWWEPEAEVGRWTDGIETLTREWGQNRNEWKNVYSSMRRTTLLLQVWQVGLPLIWGDTIVLQFGALLYSSATYVVVPYNVTNCKLSLLRHELPRIMGECSSCRAQNVFERLQLAVATTLPRCMRPKPVMTNQEVSRIQTCCSINLY